MFYWIHYAKRSLKNCLFFSPDIFGPIKYVLLKTIRQKSCFFYSADIFDPPKICFAEDDTPNELFCFLFWCIRPPKIFLFWRQFAKKLFWLLFWYIWCPKIRFIEDHLPKSCLGFSFDIFDALKYVLLRTIQKKTFFFRCWMTSFA